MSPAKLKERIKSLAIEVGFVRLGVAPAGAIDPSARKAMRNWLESGMDADMKYMSRNLAKRLDPSKLVPGAACVICLAAGYAPPAGARNFDADRGPEPFVARYARGGDYHKLLKKRCARLVSAIRELEPLFRERVFVDGAPVAERTLAVRAGLGIIGRNGSLIVPGLGSYVLLCEIICNLPLEPDEPLPGGCGDCSRCVRACPTGAISPGKLVDARRCLSYHTIENPGVIPVEIRDVMGVRVIGCDSCQEACPHNRSARSGDAELTGDRPLGGATLAEILRWDRGDWDAATRGCATRRAKFETLMRNAVIASGNSCDPSLAGDLIDLAGRHEYLREYVQWALGRLDVNNHL